MKTVVPIAPARPRSQSLRLPLTRDRRTLIQSTASVNVTACVYVPADRGRSSHDGLRRIASVRRHELAEIRRSRRESLGRTLRDHPSAMHDDHFIEALQQMQSMNRGDQAGVAERREKIR